MNIIFSEGSGLNDSIFGKCQAPIRMFLEKKAEAFEEQSMLKEFFAICDYFEITPVEFFDPKLNKEAVELIHSILKLSDKDRENVVDIVNAFIHKEENPIPEELKSLNDSDK